MALKKGPEPEKREFIPYLTTELIDIDDRIAKVDTEWMMWRVLALPTEVAKLRIERAKLLIVRENILAKAPWIGQVANMLPEDFGKAPYEPRHVRRNW